MRAIPRDPLLAIARGLLWFLMGVFALAGAACLVAVLPVLIFRSDIAAGLAVDAPDVSSGHLMIALVGLLLVTALMMGLLLRMLYHLKRIVDTVGEGDPFVPENATRLTGMAWLSLDVQILGIPLAGLGQWLAHMAKASGAMHLDFSDGNVSGNGLLLMLVLFILARVFRKGAEMRAELAETV
ncbi:DUF2975 domain-containing protein [Novosphingobium sp. 9]|uniref:DUF2975 domain-containing protein n=1 Tax=Novosphingobium sp. 9 TaxID=2025349 RepID=UPI0021B698AD|nr:DUF2975 domain-containing protein [Novosphingobium sp. 9]